MFNQKWQFFLTQWMIVTDNILFIIYLSILIHLGDRNDAFRFQFKDILFYSSDLVIAFVLFLLFVSLYGNFPINSIAQFPNGYWSLYICLLH